VGLFLYRAHVLQADRVLLNGRYLERPVAGRFVIHFVTNGSIIETSYGVGISNSEGIIDTLTNSGRISTGQYASGIQNFATCGLFLKKIL
jgi:hypothetical protein